MPRLIIIYLWYLSVYFLQIMRINKFESLTMIQFIISLERLGFRPMTPNVLGYFGAQDQLSWLSVTFFLMQLCCIPLFGKLCDVFNRKASLLAALAVFCVGAIVSASSQGFIQLVCGRSIEAFGAGGVNTVFFIIVSDLVPLKHRGKYQNYVQAAFIVTAAVAPYIGGALVNDQSRVDQGLWRYLFVGSASIAFVSFVLLSITLKLPAVPGKDDGKYKHVDFVGIVLVFIASFLVAFGLETGDTYGWGSALIVCLLVFGVVTSALFVYYEITFVTEDNAVLPFRLLFSSSNAVVIYTLVFLFEVASTVYSFQNLYYQTIGEIAPELSGYVAYAETIGSVVAALSVSWFLSLKSNDSEDNSGDQTPTESTGLTQESAPGQLKHKLFDTIFSTKLWLVVGFLLAIAGLLLMAFRLKTDVQLWELCLQQAVYGLGLGIIDLILLLGAQEAFSQKTVAVATSSYFIFRSLGGIVGNPIMQQVQRLTLRTALVSRYPPNTNQRTIDSAMKKGTRGIPANLIGPTRLAYSDSAFYVFLVGACVMAFAMLIGVLFLKSFSLPDKFILKEQDDDESKTEQDEEQEVA